MTDESGVHFLGILCCSKCQVSKTVSLWFEVAVSYSRNVTFAEAFSGCQEEDSFWREFSYKSASCSEEKQCPGNNLKPY